MTHRPVVAEVTSDSRRATDVTRGQAPQNSELAELSFESNQRLAPPILNFAVSDPGQSVQVKNLPHDTARPSHPDHPKPPVPKSWIPQRVSVKPGQPRLDNDLSLDEPTSASDGRIQLCLAICLVSVFPLTRKLPAAEVVRLRFSPSHRSFTTSATGENNAS
jgi:hypothetical protein